MVDHSIIYSATLKHVHEDNKHGLCMKESDKVPSWPQTQHYDMN